MSIDRQGKYCELGSLLFETRQIIRANVSGGKPDPNRWLRLELLRFIATTEVRTMQEVAAYLRIKAPSATSLVANLKKSGLVKRVRASDKRVTLIALTASGKRAVDLYCRDSEDTLHRVFSKLSSAEVIGLQHTLRRLTDSHKQTE